LEAEAPVREHASLDPTKSLELLLTMQLSQSCWHSARRLRPDPLAAQAAWRRLSAGHVQKQKSLASLSLLEDCRITNDLCSRFAVFVKIHYSKINSIYPTDVHIIPSARFLYI